MRNIKRTGIWNLLGCIALFVLSVQGFVAVANGSVSPETFVATLAPGESVSEKVTVNIPSTPPKVDVVFAFDLTGSMGDILNTAKSRAIEIMTTLDVLDIDISYGVVSYMDYPNCYNSYGYNSCYGTAGDYAYAMNQAITSERSSVTSAINALTLGNGEDGPEAYTRVLYESYSDSSIEWRSGAKKILINFADNIPHDNNLNEGVTAGTWSTGGDPGRDEEMFTSDDLDLQTVLSEMATNNVVLLEAHTTSSYQSYWQYWAKITGGSFFITNSSTMVNDVASAISSELVTATVSNLHMAASTGYESWLTSVSPSSYSGKTGTSTDFTVTLTVPDGTDGGSYSFTLSALDDSNISYGDQSVAIAVPVSAPTPTPSPSPSPTQTPTGSGIVYGFVTDEYEEPLKSVSVSLTGPNSNTESASTDADGYYFFENLIQGDYTIRASKSGYETASKEFALGDGGTKEVNFQLAETTSGYIYGFVKDISGDPVENVRLTLKGVKTRYTAKSASDKDGFFEFTDLDADTYVIKAKKKRYRQSKTTVELEEYETKEIEIEMRATTSRKVTDFKN